LGSIHIQCRGVKHPQPYHVGVEKDPESDIIIVQILGNETITKGKKGRHTAQVSPIRGRLRVDLNIIGETAAIVTSLVWTLSSIFFTSAGKKIGSLSVNAYRTVMAVLLLVLTHVILLGTILPAASGAQWFWLGLSGVVGLSVGDSGLFAAYLAIGPRRSLLLMALAPIFASVGAYVMLRETIPAFDLLGMAIAIAGVVVVILEREELSGEPAVSKRLKGYGVLLGLIAGSKWHRERCHESPARSTIIPENDKQF
jgi:uncharacterized membrane protein